MAEVPPFVSGQPRELRPGLIELPDGTILDGINARTIEVGTEEWYRIMGDARKADADRDFGGNVDALDAAVREQRQRALEQRRASSGVIAPLLLLRPGEQPLRQADTAEKVKSLVLLAIVVAAVVYLTRGK